MANDFSLRKDNSELPSMAEVHKIRTIEAVRTHSSDTEGKHFTDFATIIALLKSYSLPTDYFEKVIKTHAVDSKDVEDFTEVLTQLVAMILQEKDPKRIKLLGAVYAYLTQADAPMHADIAIVLGGRSLERPRKAAELFKAGLVPRIICCGSRPVYVDPTGSTEAQRFADVLVDEGVPKGAILLESNSRTTPDNIRSVLNLLDAKKLPYSKILLVTSPYAMRRAWACLKKYLPQSHVVMRAPSKPEPHLSSGQWFKTEKSLRIFLNEYVKMAIAESFQDA
jgi:uncharacterized SAM-binding protein YcdF (DUF218 family)